MIFFKQKRTFAEYDSIQEIKKEDLIQLARYIQTLNVEPKIIEKTKESSQELIAKHIQELGTAISQIGSHKHMGGKLDKFLKEARKIEIEIQRIGSLYDVEKLVSSKTALIFLGELLHQLPKESRREAVGLCRQLGLRFPKL